MYKKSNFKRKLIASAVASCAMSGLGTVAVAQEDASMLEEVVVTGIRASLDRAMDIKRDSAGVVDAISAEDIGKFPDSNLAESLQRITGVSIDRRNGEGYQVTVRGFGPQFNLVTVNGRALPTSRINISKSGGGGAAADRGFDMSNIAAEGVSGVQVYKTAQASIPTGGIGATVNLETRRPFDTEGFTATVGAKALHDTTVRVGDDITPEFSTFLSWSNDMFGASVAFTHQERDSAQTGVFTNSYSAYSGAWTDASFIESVPYVSGGSEPSIGAGDVDVFNPPTVGQQTNITQGVRYYHEDRERTRDNAQVTLQFRPMENLTGTLDYTRAEQEVKINGSELSFWFGGGTFPTTDVEFDGHPEAAAPVYLWAENPTGVVRDLGITQNGGGFNNTLESTGINIEFNATDTLTFTLDAHHSESESLPADGMVGGYFNIGLGAQGVYGQGYDMSGDLPLLVGVFEDDHRDGSGDFGLVENELDVGDLGSTVRQIWNPRTTSEMDQIRLDGEWEFSDRGSINFGIESRKMESSQLNSFNQQVLEGNWGVGTPGDVPPEMMDRLDYADLFDGYSTTLDSDAQAFFDQAGVDGNNTGAMAQVFTTGWIAHDTSELGRYLSSNVGLEWEPNPDNNENRTIEEEINAAYIQASYQVDIGDMPLDILAGIRYEETDVTSIGQVAGSTILWQGDNDLTTQAGSVASAPIEIGTGSYDNVLPSIALSLGVTEDVIVRAAYSETISRPSYNNLQAGINGVQAPNGGPTILGAMAGTAQNGNPALDPLESNNYDLSVEWYYGDSSYASIGYFYKDVPNFVGTSVTPTPLNSENTLNPVLDPTNGPRAQAAIDELNSRGIPVNQQSLFRMIASMNLVPGACIEAYNQEGETAANSASCGDPYDAWEYEGTAGWEDNIDLVAVSEGEYMDPTYTANVNFPVGSKSATLDGWELAVQHFFGESGFGVQANYTIVDGDISYDITGSPTASQFALTGLSDSANLVLIYEKNDWSGRLAYNWRDNFLYSTTDAANEPGHTEDYSQIDLNVSYAINDNFTVSFEGLNLTEEDSRNYARTEQQVLRMDILGARYALSARYTF